MGIARRAIISRITEVGYLKTENGREKGDGKTGGKTDFTFQISLPFSALRYLFSATKYSLRLLHYQLSIRIGNMKVMVVGARGMLGADLVKILSPLHRVIGVDNEEFDITDWPVTSSSMAEIGPDAVINCAAWTDVDGCERDPDRAFAVNARGAGFVARAAAECGARLIHISTDFVFDGRKRGPYTEDAAPNPLSVYGRSKLAGEGESLGYCPGCLVVRTAWLFGRNGKNFVDTIIKISSGRESIEVVDDQTGSPTYSVDLSGALAALLDRGTSGILNVTNSGHCSWWEYAAYIVDILGISCAVRPVSSERIGRPAPRPAFSILSTDRLEAELGHTLRPWREAVKEYIESTKPSGFSYLSC